MSRHRSGSAYGHTVRKIDHDHYRMSWVVDRYYPDSNLRHPRIAHRDTDEAGALRFANKHGVEVHS